VRGRELKNYCGVWDDRENSEISPDLRSHADNVPEGYELQNRFSNVTYFQTSQKLTAF